MNMTWNCVFIAFLVAMLPTRAHSVDYLITAGPDPSPTAARAASELAKYIELVTEDAAIIGPAERQTIGTSLSGHYVTYNGKTLMLVGDSGTQCVMQNTNINHRQWIDDCAGCGLRTVHIWAMVAPRQKQDGSKLESRYRYVYPGITPWARRTSGNSATDQLKQWDTRTFDEGADGDLTHYWPRLRDLCSYAKSKDVMVGITVFFGWPKRDLPWLYHPFNAVNGGHLTSKQAVQTIYSPGTEVLTETWSDSWPSAKKTQWVWERFCKKLIDDVGSLGNVWFTFMDEHSYSEGNCGDHFLSFFRKRGQIWADWNNRRSDVSWVCSKTFVNPDKNSRAVSGFTATPARPYLLLEGHPYIGDAVRTSIWTFAIGGGHFHFHNDYAQETETTGIMCYDPNARNGNRAADLTRRGWLGHASRLFNDIVLNLDAMAPHNDLASGSTYVLANPGSEYVVYSMIGSAATFTLDLGAVDGPVYCRFYNPRTGTLGTVFSRAGGSTQSFTKADSSDWVLHLTTAHAAPELSKYIELVTEEAAIIESEPSNASTVFVVGGRDENPIAPRLAKSRALSRLTSLKPDSDDRCDHERYDGLVRDCKSGPTQIAKRLGRDLEIPTQSTSPYPGSRPPMPDGFFGYVRAASLRLYSAILDLSSRSLAGVIWSSGCAMKLSR